MIITPGDKAQKLRRPLSQVVRVDIKSRRFGWVTVPIVTLTEIETLYNRNGNTPGEPAYLSVAGPSTVIVFPVPDKKYTCRILGTILVEL